jgi:hypothetical protein
MKIRNGWLAWARVAWVVVTAVALALVVFSVPLFFAQLRTVCLDAADVCFERLQLTPSGVQALRQAGLSHGLYAALVVGIDAFFKLVWCAVGMLIFWRKSDDRMALLVSLFLITFGTVTFSSTAVDLLISADPVWWLPAKAVQILGEVCVVLFFLLFPGGQFVPRWTRWLAPAFLVFQVPTDLFPDLLSGSPALERLSGVVFLCFVGSMLWSQIYRYRNVSNPSQRRQTRWVVFGTTLAIAGMFVFVVPFFFIPLLVQTIPLVQLVLGIGIMFSMLLIPLSIGVAVLRSGLFDIDVIINRTLVYGILTASLALIYVASVVVLRGVVFGFTGQSSPLTVVVSTLVVAALFQPLRRRIQALIDRRFYRRKYDAAQTLQMFSVKLRNEVDLDALSGDLLYVVHETMQPAHVSLWLCDVKRET